MSQRHVIIGHGPAGMSAAEAIRARQPDAVITLISDEPYPFYSRPGLAYYFADRVPQGQLSSRPKDHYARSQLKAVNARAEQIEPDRHLVYLGNRQDIPYDRLLLAMGSIPVRPDIPGVDLAGVVTLNSRSDTVDILHAIQRARTAVVVGGGITALEMIEGFRARGLKTHYLLRRERFWSAVLSQTESDLILRRLAGDKVQAHTHVELVQIHGRAGRVTGIETNIGLHIECVVVGIAVGVRPQSGLARQAGLRTSRGVLVDAHMRTSAPDILTAGDVAEIVEDGDSTGKLDMLWPITLATGRIAGANMVGADVAYHRGIALNVSCLAGMWVTIWYTEGALLDEEHGHDRWQDILAAGCTGVPPISGNHAQPTDAAA
jgi:NAD(P)H-nitrite reductase large subunit